MGEIWGTNFRPQGELWKGSLPAIVEVIGSAGGQSFEEFSEESAMTYGETDGFQLSGLVTVFVTKHFRFSHI